MVRFASKAPQTRCAGSASLITQTQFWCFWPAAQNESCSATKLQVHHPAQIALALQYIHEHHILHRDLKPQNVFMTTNGHIVLGDFGVSKVRSANDLQYFMNNFTVAVPQAQVMAHSLSAIDVLLKISMHLSPTFVRVVSFLLQHE
jgi:serine/threonine protein kinase